MQSLYLSIKLTLTIELTFEFVISIHSFVINLRYECANQHINNFKIYVAINLNFILNGIEMNILDVYV